MHAARCSEQAVDVGVRSNSSTSAKWSGPKTLDLVLEVAGRDHGTEDFLGVDEVVGPPRSGRLERASREVASVSLLELRDGGASPEEIHRAARSCGAPQTLIYAGPHTPLAGPGRVQSVKVTRSPKQFLPVHR